MDVPKCYNPHIQSSLTAKIIKYYFFHIHKILHNPLTNDQRVLFI